jgi:hypothetical protein
MATVAGIKIKAKAPRASRVHFADEKYTGSEPVWDTERALTFSDADFDHHLRRSFYYYNYHYSQKDCKKHVVEWMQREGAGYTKSDIKAFIRASDRSLSMTACGLIMAHRQGMPMKPRHMEFLKEAIGLSINSAEPEVEEVAIDKPKPYVPTIQDRLNEKTAETIGELEGHFDEIMLNPKYVFKAYDFFVTNNVPQSQLSKYEDVFQRRFNELKSAYEKEDEQLVEGYKHFKAADFKRLFTFLDQLLTAIEQYRGVKKATKKVRAPRAVSKEKVVGKLKYAKEDKALKIISINPADIVNTKELWVYNVKTRKLGRYVAEEYKDLTVKGTTIVNFSQNKSVQKTLRKPEEKLREFAKASKVQLRKFLEEIKSTEVQLNGRINADTLLLKVS